LSDTAFLAAAAVIAAQLITLPYSLRLRIAPSSIAYEQIASLSTAAASARSASLSGPMTVNRTATLFALLAVIVALVLFWSARSAFRRGGVRSTIRGIALMGTVLAPLGVIQHSIVPHRFYGLWTSHIPTALVYTPFMNRNDFASWLIMAIPLTAGYALAHIQSRRRSGAPFDPESAFDNMTMMLGIGLIVMTAAVIAAMSRSALIGSSAALVVFVLLSRGRMSRKWIVGMLGSTAAVVTVAAVYAANIPALTTRFSGAVSEGLTGRVAIWKQTWPMVRDFWPVGSGAGTYQQVMVLYQTTTSRLFYISHADNEYLQVLAEGGALLAIPAAIAVIALAAIIVKRLRSDRTNLFWIRAGAACGLVAVAVQNFFEMTLRVPANGVLLAIVAAIAAHEGPSDARR
jgi:O-antigen ligase